MTDPASTPNKPPEVGTNTEPASPGKQEPSTTSPGTSPSAEAGGEPPPGRPAEPVSEEASVREAGRRGQASPRKIMMECFGSAFHSEDALRGFCFNHFGDVHKTLKDTDRFFGIVRELICYCESRGRVTQLWDCLASENQAQYKQWFPRWSKAREKYRDSREAEYAEFRGSASPPRPDEDRSSSGHPLLSGNPETVSDWFFSDLDPSERGMVLATALFQGMNRTHLVAVAQSFGKLLGSPTDESVADGSTTE